MAVRYDTAQRARRRAHSVDAALTKWLGGGAGLVVALRVPSARRVLCRFDARLPGLASGLERIGARYGLHPIGARRGVHASQRTAART